MQVWSLGWEDSLEEEIATHSSILPWSIPWTEEPGRLQFMWSHVVRHNWVTNTWPLNYLSMVSVQFSSIAKSCPTLCDPMNRSMPGLPVHHQLPEFTQTQHPSSQWCHPAISSSGIPFSSFPQSLPASESFPMSQLFAWRGQSTGVSALASFLPKKSQADLLQNGLVGSPCSSRDSQEFSLTPQFKGRYSDCQI